MRFVRHFGSSLFLFAGLLAASLGLLARLPGAPVAHAQGGVIYVAPSGTDTPTCGAVTNPCRTLRYAVESRAQPGDRIEVAAGTYTDPVTIAVPGLYVQGAGQTRSLLDGEGARGPMLTFAPGLTATTVFSGFGVLNGITTTTVVSGGGVYINNSSPRLQFVRVQSNTGDGLYLAGGAQPTLHGNIFCGNSAFQLENSGDATPDATGNWWGTNTPRPGKTYTGSLRASPPIVVRLQLRQILTGSGSLGSGTFIGTGSLFVGAPARITATMRGGGYDAPPGTTLLLRGQDGFFPGGVTATTLSLVRGQATTVFTPTSSQGVVISAFHPCNGQTAVATLDYRRHLYLPLILKTFPLPPSTPEPTCPTTSSATFDLIPVDSPPADHPDYLHGDLNLSLRGYEPVQGVTLALVDYNGGVDADAPQLPALFTDNRVPVFSAAYQVYDWNWDCGGQPHGCRGALLSHWPTTLIGMQTTPGESIRIPSRAPEIYGGGYRALVLYAEEQRITLGYVREDTVAHGYAVHIENVCVDPNLLALYRSRVDANGNRITSGGLQLPALKNGQSLGTAAGTEIRVAVRDRGNFMDPRSRKDWWQGR